VPLVFSVLSWTMHQYNFDWISHKSWSAELDISRWNWSVFSLLSFAIYPGFWLFNYWRFIIASYPCSLSFSYRKTGSRFDQNQLSCCSVAWLLSKKSVTVGTSLAMILSHQVAHDRSWKGSVVYLLLTCTCINFSW
jgi:hypothetical protein